MRIAFVLRDEGFKMHELSIAVNLVEVAEQAALSAGVHRITSIHLKLGVFAGVVKDALLFAYETAAKDTLLEGSVLEIEDVPLVVYCDFCQQERRLASVQWFVCPVCGNPVMNIRQGQELVLVSMEIIDDEPTAD